MVARRTVTADTNVYISALNFGGKPRQLLEAAHAGLFELVVSDAILVEVERVLLTKFGWHPERIDAARRAVAAFTRRVAPARRIAAVPGDPDDDRILECAIASQSHLLVSGDKHLLRMGEFEGIRILTVAAFMERYGLSARAPDDAP